MGGPKGNIDREDATKLVDDYVAEAAYRTPAENPYVLDLIGQLGFQTVEEFVINSTILSRKL